MVAKKAAAKTAGPVAFQFVRDELSGASDLLAAQNKAGLPEEETRESLFKNALHHVESLGKMTIAQQIELTNLVTDGPWTVDQKLTLASALRAQGHGGSTDGTAKKWHRRKG